MRMRRMVAEGVGYYHVISRITGQQFLVGDEEKDVLMRLPTQRASEIGQLLPHQWAPA